jgi:hypothetical protein
VSHHLAERGILAADTRHVAAPELVEPDHVWSVVGHGVLSLFADVSAVHLPPPQEPRSMLDFGGMRYLFDRSAGTDYREAKTIAAARTFFDLG